MKSTNSLYCRRALRAARRGQTLVEYALIVALVAVVAIGVLMAMGGTVRGTFLTINNQLATAQLGGGTGSNPGARNGGG